MLIKGARAHNGLQLLEVRRLIPDPVDVIATNAACSASNQNHPHLQRCLRERNRLRAKERWRTAIMLPTVQRGTRTSACRAAV
jgi:hypothetical protein